MRFHFLVFRPEKSRREDTPGVAQLREEVAALRGDVDHIRSAMQDMHREVNQTRASTHSMNDINNSSEVCDGRDTSLEELYTSPNHRLRATM